MNYIVFIPYIHAEAQGRELEYAVAGWQMHFKEKHNIVIVGDFDDNVKNCLFRTREGSEVTYIKKGRVPEPDIKNYRAHLDFVPKMKAVRQFYPYSRGFIYTCDDIYAVNDFNIDDVKALKYVPGGVDFDPNSPNPFRRDKMKTKRVLQDMGFPCRNFTTHLPLWIEWDKLEKLWMRYDMEHNSLVFEDLYYNYYYPVSGAIAIDGDDEYKCEVRNSHPDRERLQRALTEKIWINNSPTGFCQELDDILKQHYNL